MDLVEYYYEQAFGYYPFENEMPKERTKNTIDFFRDNLISESDILKIIEQYSSLQNAWMLPWAAVEYPPAIEGTLLEHQVFYYHPALQIRPPGPVFNPVTGESKPAKFFLEMKLKFTKEDLLNHIRKELALPLELADDARDLGAVQFLLDKYKKITIANPVDFILFLVDEAKNKEQRVFSILDLSQGEHEVYELFHRMVPEMTAKKANQIVWR